VKADIGKYPWSDRSGIHGFLRLHYCYPLIMTGLAVRRFIYAMEEKMNSKYVRESSLIVSHILMPQDANVSGNVVHGGVIMKHIDTTAGMVAARHSRGRVVTASIDRLDFHNPAYVGNLLILKASINMVGRTSMEVGVRVETEEIITGATHLIASAYLTFVALDDKGRPREAPQLILETDEENRRHREALARRKTRLLEKEKEKECQENPDECKL
jgi:acyl-CoA hydrolase